MLTEKQFLTYLEDANESFSGWDFSFLSETGRVQNQLLSWSYGSMVMSLVHNAQSMLDMGTGGGEFLSKIKPYPQTVFATEAYLPNIPIAKKRLEPLGVKVVQIDDDSNLPFEDRGFDLIINRHESYSPKEVRRIISDHGVFLTQQAGGTDCSQINEHLGVPSNDEFIHWNLNYAIEELRDNHFKVNFSKEEFPIQRFYDIGALVYYLKAIPWQVPGFTIEQYIDKLHRIHQLIQSKGNFDVKQHRFIIKAEAI
ncbi:methyltransferase domain-containing protein [Heyndrickxia sp. NPDC080065]|uniref:methyltransferase domain-containing protein n=1 Tax=Heyndrickxia sp. NPDC080065 TaxID=3390568 RepID=UPI003CFF5EC2